MRSARKPKKITSRRRATRQRVLLVESQPIVREKLIELISAEPDLMVCGVTDECNDLVEVVNETKPHLLIIEVAGRHGHRLGQIRAVRQARHDLPILVFSLGPCDTYALRAMHAGATSYLCKNAALDDIRKVIRQTAKGTPSLCHSMTSKLVRQLSSGFADAAQPPVQKLSNREIEVFELIGQGLGTRQIASRLSLRIPTVETYRERLKTKLHLRGAVELQCAAVRWVERRVEP